MDLKRDRANTSTVISVMIIQSVKSLVQTSLPFSLNGSLRMFSCKWHGFESLVLSRADWNTSEIDDFTQPWTREDNSLDYIHLRWICGTVTDWTELFRQAYRVLKPGGWIESFDCNGFPESDDGTLTEDTALYKWGYLIREGAKALGSRASFAVVQDGLQVQGLKEAGFTNITENPVKVRRVF